MSFDIQKMRADNVIGKGITAARKHKKISQQELAALLNEYNIIIKPGSISKWENGDSMPNPYQLTAVCHVLNVSYDQIIGFSPISDDYTPELSQKGLNLLLQIKEALVASGIYQPINRKETDEEIKSGGSEDSVPDKGDHHE